MIGQAPILARIGGVFWLFLGRWMDRKGMTSIAESCYRNAAANAGRQGADAAFRLTQLYLANDRNPDAVTVCEHALSTCPTHARLWCALGAARRRLAQIDAAGEAYRKAIALEPAYAQAWSNLGEWHMVKGEHKEALANFDQALRLEPRLLQALNNRVAALYESGRFDDAETSARQAIDIHPDEAALHVNLANVLLHTGKGRLAFDSFRKALEHDPACSEAHLGLATMLGESRHLSETLTYIENEIASKGESAQRLVALAAALHAKGDCIAAEATCNKVLEIQPNNVSALITLAGCFSARADHQSAIRLQQEALAQNPGMPGIYSNIAFDSTYLPDISSDVVFDYHHGWAEQFEKKADIHVYKHDHGGLPDRPLRIAYVSGDFGSHPVGFLLRDVILHHDRKQFVIHCYSMMRSNDDPVTVAIRGQVDSWVDALFMNDDELAQKIYADKIDILVDLSGHTAYNRLPVFVRNPAPLQATWIGYFHSTGLDSIDYFITDPYTTPIDGGQRFSETPIFLPHSRFCYSPPHYGPQVALPPFLTTGGIVFGSFNRLEKLVQPVVDAWVAIVNAVEGSKLLLKAGRLDNEGIAADLRRRFVAAGLDEERLVLRGGSPHQDMLGQYGEIDIALDTFPFNGGMTTLEALWMGVPVIAMAGQSVVSRQSTSALMNIGLSELIFSDLATYIGGAIALAQDHQRLVNMRREMRVKMSKSPVCQPEQFTQDLEMLYRRMWQAWCKGEKLGTDIVPSPAVIRKTVLHVGCGGADIRSLPTFFHRRWQEIRLDIDPSAHPDILGTVMDMSGVLSESVDAVFSSHTLEHLYAHELPIALAEMRRVLKPDGFMVSTVPDLQSAARMIAEDRLFDTAYMSPAGAITPFDILYSYRGFVSRDRPYMAHHGGFTLTTLIAALKEAGFDAVTGRRRESSFDLWVLGATSIPEEQFQDLADLCLPK